MEDVKPAEKRARTEAPRDAIDALDVVPVAGVTPSNPRNPVVFLDVSIDAIAIGRIKIELYADVCPKTAENFRQLCTGETKRNGLPAGYKSVPFHRVVPGFVVQGGDCVNRDGTGTFSIYGDVFEDESTALQLKHDRAGVVSMANPGMKDRNSCQFFITLNPAPKLDGLHAVVGQVVAGGEIVQRIEAARINSASSACVITECGQL
jgi:peptidyl-prolyl isomerase H (cyclophilin H)